MSPLADLLGERVSPEMLYLETKFASVVAYRLTVRLMGEVLPLDRPIRAERVRRHRFRVAEAHEAELASAPTSITADKHNRRRTDRAKERAAGRTAVCRHGWRLYPRP